MNKRLGSPIFSWGPPNPPPVNITTLALSFKWTSSPGKCSRLCCIPLPGQIHLSVLQKILIDLTSVFDSSILSHWLTSPSGKTADTRAGLCVSCIQKRRMCEKSFQREDVLLWFMGICRIFPGCGLNFLISSCGNYAGECFIKVLKLNAP